MQTHKRGAFIVFEGLDRSGKSTQTNLLLNYLKLKNIKSVQMRFPGISFLYKVNYNIIIIFN